MTLPDAQPADLAEAVISRLGLSLHRHNVLEVEAALGRGLQRTGCASLEAYAKRLAERDFAARELPEIAQELTAAETFFFRHREQFHALGAAVLPERIRARQATRRLNVLSAGCATGEEIYSVAAVLADFSELRDWDVRLCGVDVNPRLLQHARTARYTDWSLRQVTEQQRSRYFRMDGKAYRLDATLARAVHFEARNLLEDDPQFWQPDFFDLVFCRNVMIYFSDDAVRRLVERLAHCLVPGGFLFIGPSETLRGVSQAFNLRHSQGAFYYQRRLPHEQMDPALPLANMVSRFASPSPVPKKPNCSGWASTIAASSARIAAIAARPQRESRRLDAGTVVPAPKEPGLGEVRNLVREERFEDVLKAIDGLPGQTGIPSDTLLIQAVALAHRNELAEAEALCQRMIEHDGLAAAAHYLLAFCQERRGEYLSAAEHDQMSICLDPAFAMPHLHLGLLALHLRDLVTARRQLGDALSLLAHEDAARILLFGAGLDRAALQRLCAAQLVRCGGGR